MKKQAFTNNKKILLKVGGSIVNDEQLIDSLCEELKELKAAGFDIVIVHGGSKAINSNLAIHGIQSEFIDGLRITSWSAMKIIEMVLCGHVNQLLIKKLNSAGLSAVGLSGASQHMLLCDYSSKQLGFVGKITQVNASIVHHLLASPNTHPSTIPVIAPVGLDSAGNALNINADIAASHLANALQVDHLIFLTDQDGIYDANGNIFSQLCEEDLQALIASSVVSAGMLVKVQAILCSLKAGLNNILILNGNKKQLVSAILNQKETGTLCKKARISTSRSLTAGSKNSATSMDPAVKLREVENGSLIGPACSIS